MARTDTLSHFLTDVADAIRTKTGSSAAIDADDFDTEIVNIPSGGGTVEVVEKDVNFYDYDGTRINSYTKTEFLALESLPSNPSHAGLTAQGWNWNLTDAKAHVTKYGTLDIGQMYNTSNGATKIYIRLEDGRLSPYLGFGINGTAIVDWGDNSETTTVTGSDGTTVTYTPHVYSEPGEYIISISSEDTIHILGSSNYTSLLKSTNLSTTDNRDTYYRNAIVGINLSTNVDISGNYSLYGCYNLSFVTIPNGITSIGYGCFNLCSFLPIVIIPSGITVIEEYCFTGCNNLSYIVLPNNLTSIGGYTLQNCNHLRHIVMPDTVTSVGSYAFKLCNSLSYATALGSTTSFPQGVFQNCYGPRYYDFSTATSVPPMENKNAFSGIASDCKIIVPDALYNSWKTTSNWSNYASNIISKTDWDALQS